MSAPRRHVMIALTVLLLAAPVSTRAQLPPLELPPPPEVLLQQIWDRIDLRRALTMSGGALTSLAIVTGLMNWSLTSELMVTVARRLLIVGAVVGGSRGAGWIYDQFYAPPSADGGGTPGVATSK